MKRRNLLKTVGLSGVALAGVPVGGAAEESATGRKPAHRNENLDQSYREALRIRQRNGSRDEFVSSLKANGLRVQTVSETKTVDMHYRDDSDTVSTQEFEKLELSTYMSLIYNNCDDAWYMDYDFGIDTVVGDDSGNAQPHGSGGPDQISVSCHPDHWYIDSNDWYHGGLNNLSYSESSLSGVTFAWKDGQSCYYGCDVNGWVGSRVRPLSTSQTRLVRGEYNHTWNSLSLSGFTVGSDGSVSFGTEDTSRMWEAGVHVLREDEASYSCAV